jgi:hypothetical protein
MTCSKSISLSAERWATSVDGRKQHEQSRSGRPRALQADRERQKRRRLEDGESSRRRLRYGNLFPSSSPDSLCGCLGGCSTRSGGRFAALLVHPSRRGRVRTARNERHARRAKGEPRRTASGPRRMAMAGRASACGSTARGVVAVVEPCRCGARCCCSELLPAARRRAEQAGRGEGEPGGAAPRPPPMAPPG